MLETCPAGEKPEDLVMVLAHAKADAIKARMASAGENMSGYLLTCDQVGDVGQQGMLPGEGNSGLAGLPPVCSTDARFISYAAV